MSDPYQIIERLPTPDEYRRICTAVGWELVINFDAAPKSLEQSLFGVVALYEGEAIGMGRVVGDGAIYFYIQDIAVVPEHQSKAVGHQILQAIMHYLRTNAPKQAFVGLFASEGTEEFYKRYEFMIHSALTGMFQVID